MGLRYSVILTPVSETVPLYPLPLPRKTFHSSVERKKMPTVLISKQNNKPAAAQSHNCWKSRSTLINQKQSCHWHLNTSFHNKSIIQYSKNTTFIPTPAPHEPRVNVLFTSYNLTTVKENNCFSVFSVVLLVRICECVSVRLHPDVVFAELWGWQWTSEHKTICWNLFKSFYILNASFITCY